MINADDRIIIGDTYPKWTGSIYNRLTWKSFDASALATARVGYLINDAFGTTNNNLYGRYGNLLVDYWTPSNPSNTNPRPSAGRKDPPFNTSRAYRRGSHWRIRNITLGYTLPQSLIIRIGASSLRDNAAARSRWSSRIITATIRRTSIAARRRVTVHCCWHEPELLITRLDDEDTKMKRLFSSVLAVVGLASLGGCVDLDEELVSGVSSTFYETPT